MISNITSVLSSFFTANNDPAPSCKVDLVAKKSLLPPPLSELDSAMENRDIAKLTELAHTLPSLLQKRLFHFCWEQNIPEPIVALCNRSGANRISIKLIAWDKLVAGNLEAKKEVVLAIRNHLGSNGLHLIVKDFVARCDVPFAQAFFKTDLELLPVLFQETLSEEETLFLFQLFWDTPSLLGDKNIDQIEDLASDVEKFAPGLIQNLVRSEIETTTIGPAFFTPVLGAVMDYLDFECTQIISQLLDSFCSAPDLSDVAKKQLTTFISAAEENSLVAWKYNLPEEERDYILIARGSQAGKDGPVDVNLAEKSAVSLLLSAPPSVGFKPLAIDANLTGGTCTAMTMKFLHDFKVARKEMGPLAAIEKIAPDFATSSEEFRSKQSAYNTIHRTVDSTPDDFKKDKIEALLKLENPTLTIRRETPLINLNDEDISIDLEEGVYVVRALHLDETNEKEEAYGHSTLLIIEGENRFYYDPAIGPLQLTHPNQLGMVLQWQHTRWNIPAVRFYEITEALT